jgi:hypothetical protein
MQGLNEFRNFHHNGDAMLFERVETMIEIY